MTDTEHKLAIIVADAEVVVDSVTMDDQGKVIGQIWMGGSGGLLSKTTLRAVDKLRKTIMAIKASSGRSAVPGQEKTR